MKLQLRDKVIGLAVFCALLPIVVLTLLLLIREGPLVKYIKQEITDLTEKSFHAVVHDMYSSCQTANDLITQGLENMLKLANYLAQQSGGIQVNETKEIEWPIINPQTKQTKNIKLPEILIGDKPLEKNLSFSEKTPIIDTLKDLLGGAISIYQKINDTGDMLRIATTISTLSNDRAIGTTLYAIDKDNQPNPIITSLMEGQQFRGSAYLFDDWYLTAFEPIKNKKNEANEVIGAIAVGIRQKNLESLTKAIEEITIGLNGYVWIIKGTGSGDMIDNIIVKSSNVEKNMIINDQSIPVYTEIIQKARNLREKRGMEKVSWKDPGDIVPTNKTITYTYFPDWDWAIGVTAYDKDFEQPYIAIKNLFSQLKNAIFVAGLITLIIIGLVAFYLSGLLIKPITALTKIAIQVAQGDIEGAMIVIQKIIKGEDEDLAKAKERDDETGKLLKAIITMIETLDRLIGRIKNSSIQLVSTATEISNAANAQETTVQDFGVSTKQIATTVKQISSTSQDLFKTMSNISDVANETGLMADAGLAELSEMAGTMTTLSKSTSSISSKLSVISNKTANINTIVTTISKVADQTNLLSLNAAIEAEKAAEYGVGFGVVAREIRRLADQTALATLDIEQIVKEMQSAVSAGVMEMDKFTEQVHSGVLEVGLISKHLQKIIVQVQEFSPRFVLVKEGMQSQSQGAYQINGAMANLTDAANKTMNSVAEFERATQSLHTSIDQLRNEIVQFKVSDKSSAENHLTKNIKL